jgi:DNA-binding transcriptional LysR family regulator
MMLVASGKGVYLCIGVPLTSPQPAGGVAVIPISDPGATVDICAAWRRDEAAPTTLQFLECVWQIFPPEQAVPVAVGLHSRRAS